VSDVWNQHERERVESRMRSMRKWRLAISVGTLTLGVVLVVAGNVLVGVLVGGLAIARLVMFSRFPVPGTRGQMNGFDAPERLWLRSHAGNELVIAAGVIGCRVDDLRDQFQRGRSIADVAAERSIDLRQVTAAIAADITARASDAERDGSLSHAAARHVHGVAPRFADRLVHGHRGDLRPR
jgi:hypothetical protein